MNRIHMSNRETTDTVRNAIDGRLYWAAKRVVQKAPQEAVERFVDWAVDNASCGAVFWAVNGAVNEGRHLYLDVFLHDRCGRVL